MCCSVEEKKLTRIHHTTKKFKVQQVMKISNFQINLRSLMLNSPRVNFNALQTTINTMLKSQQEVKPFKSMPTLPLYKIFFRNLPRGIN